jgi:surface protein
MFRGCPFNQPLSGWDVSSVTTMHNMFNYNAPFDQDIGSWNVTGVVGTPGANDGFRGTFSTRFNNGGSPSISGWDVSNCRNMVAMFQGNSYFNQPIGYWDTSSLESMYNMFDNADAFDQDLSNWNVSNVTSATNFMVNANGLSTTNYDRTLSGWSSQSVQNGVNIHFGSSNYSTATGAAYRATLVSKGWTITDGGAV